MSDLVPPDGLLAIDKPVGPSSAAVLNRVKRSLPRGTKIGHAGTLDPLASGVLVAMLGRCTKLCERVMGQPKRYLATVTLGATSATDDAEGPIATRDATPVSREAIDAALASFVGTVLQRPPAFSAMKVGGRRACDRVRDGQVIELPPREIRIDSIAVDRYAWPELVLTIDCGRGTYVRSIARDLGEALGVGGYLSGLRRTAVGRFTIDVAATPEQIEANGVERYLLPASFADAGA